MWNWVKLSRAGKLAAEGGTKAVKRPVGEVEAELSRLRRKYASLRLDNEIVKIVAYLAKESR